MPEAANPRVKIGDNKPPTLAAILADRYAENVKKAKAWLRKAKDANLEPKTIEDCRRLEDLFGEARDIANDADRLREKEKEPHLQAGREIDAFFHGAFRDALGTDSKKGGLARQLADAAAARRLAITRAEQRKADEAAARAREEANRLEEQRKRQDEAGKVREADVTAAKVDGLDRRADELEAVAAAPIEEASRDRTVGGRSASVKAKLICTGVVRADLDLEKLRPYIKQEHLVEAVDRALGMEAFKTLKGASIQEKAVGRVR